MTETKLPLAVRKSLRDEFDPYIPEFATESEKLLGTPWTMEPNFPHLITVNTSKGFAAHPGNWAKEWFKNALAQISRISKEGKDEMVIQAINEACPAKVMTVGLGWERYSGCKLEDGKLWLMFKDADNIGANNRDTLEKLPELLTDSGSKLPLMAKKSIRDDFEPYLPTFAEESKKIFGEAWTADPNWAECFAKGSDNFKKRPGVHMKQYFTAALRQLNLQTKSGKDDMVVEAIQEMVPKKTITVGTDETQTAYSSFKFEDGKLWIMFKAGKDFGSNIDDSLQKLTAALCL